MTVKINADTSDGLKFVSDTSGAIDLQSNGVTKVSMDSSGNVGIGDSSPDGLLHVGTGDNLDGTDVDIIIGGNSVNTRQSIIRKKIQSSDRALEFIAASGGSDEDIRFYSDATTERMRINSSGQLLVGTTGVIDGSNAIGQFLNVNGGRPSLALGNGTGSSATNTIIFINSNGTVGSIQTSGSGTSFNTSSDYRLKENVDYTFDATSRLKQLKPARFNFKADADTTLDGFLAHEVSSIVPEAITGTKDATKVQDVFDSDGVKTGTETVPDYQGIDQSKLVPLLVKTIQELEARITALES